MKHILKILSIGLIITYATLLTTIVQADAPPPPPGHGETGNSPGGGGAPIGGGLIIILALGMGYAARKVYDARRKILG